MKKLAILTVLVVGTSTAAYASGPNPFNAPSNESFVAQIGYENGAIVSQNNGHNAQATIQAGARNFALTDQVAAPTFKGTTNGSLTVQVGADNTALTGQSSGYSGNPNVAATVQVGYGNFALTSQNSNSVNNTAVTAQFGAKNWAITSQR